MGFIEREISRLHAEILQAKAGPTHDKLVTAWQALSWASDPVMHRTPFMAIMEPSGLSLPRVESKA